MAVEVDQGFFLKQAPDMNHIRKLSHSHSAGCSQSSHLRRLTISLRNAMSGVECKAEHVDDREGSFEADRS